MTIYDNEGRCNLITIARECEDICPRWIFIDSIDGGTVYFFLKDYTPVCNMYQSDLMAGAPTPFEVRINCTWNCHYADRLKKIRELMTALAKEEDRDLDEWEEEANMARQKYYLRDQYEARKNEKKN